MIDAIDIYQYFYIFNFSNPMTSLFTAILWAYPNAKFIGLYHF
ncbi:hypothetical protein [Brachyspira hyodysenteriae]|nr:hypothetical protein [Brachyspira hyodysenteriae]MCZ9966176.1 hypothetical protein [Brachyspira hyodysenteriae]